MKRYLLAIYLCGAALTAWAQPRISSNKETHNFGQIEWKKPVTVDFTITNKGNKPLVLNEVTASCACAVTHWTQTPIAPGDKGVVSATFDAKMLGRFHKSIGIYSNAGTDLVYLHFVGEVVQKVTDFTNYDLESIGQIMLDKTELHFGDTHRGERPTMEIVVVNQSDRPYEPVLMHLPPYLKMTKEPSVLQKGEKGVVKLMLNTDRLNHLGLTKASVYLARFSGDKVSEENEIPFSVILLPDLSEVTERDRMNPPVIQVSRTEIDLNELGAKKDKVTYDITVGNTGRSTLKLSKIQVMNPALGATLRKSTLAPGEYTRLRVTLDKRNLKKDKPLRVLLISNDPVHPKTEINLNY